MAWGNPNSHGLIKLWPTTTFFLEIPHITHQKFVPACCALNIRRQVAQERNRATNESAWRHLVSMDSRREIRNGFMQRNRTCYATSLSSLFLVRAFETKLNRRSSQTTTACGHHRIKQVHIASAYLFAITCINNWAAANRNTGSKI